LYTSGTGAAGADASSLDARIAYYTERNATIDNILNARADENYKKNNTAFANKLDAYKVALENQAASLKTVSIAIYSGQSKTIYTTNRISVDGGVNIIIAAVAGAVLGFIIAAIVICIIDMPKYIKARDKKQEDKEEEKSKS
jgi:capsular polysaccharide biosynthesis protein